MQLPNPLSGPSPQNSSLRKNTDIFSLKKTAMKKFLIFRKMEIKKPLIIQKMKLSEYIFSGKSFLIF